MPVSVGLSAAVLPLCLPRDCGPASADRGAAVFPLRSRGAKDLQLRLTKGRSPAYADRGGEGLTVCLPRDRSPAPADRGAAALPLRSRGAEGLPLSLTRARGRGSADRGTLPLGGPRIAPEIKAQTPMNPLRSFSRIMTSSVFPSIFTHLSKSKMTGKL